MIYYKKNENTEGKRISIPDDCPFDGIVISAICAAVVGAVFAIVRKSKV